MYKKLVFYFGICGSLFAKTLQQDFYQETLALQELVMPENSQDLEEKTIAQQEEQTQNTGDFVPYKKNFFSIVSENDAYFDQFVDRYYTAGTSFSYTSREYDSGFLQLFSLNAGDKKFSRYEIALHQDVYTPQSRLAQINPLDHPYAGYLSFDFSISQRRKSSVENIKLQLGVVGPAALAKQTQELIHVLTKNPIFFGWEHQIKNEFIINLTYEYIYKFDILKSSFFDIDILPAIKFALGNANTFAGIGGRFRLGYNLESDFGVEKVNTSFLGSKPYNDKFSFYIFGGALGSYVARDIFIQGNSFGTPTSLVLEHFLYDLELGASILYKGFRLSYVFTHQSKQFASQPKGHNIGSVVLNFSF
ncbi:lipid A deacylase LpxR family protein [Helicobacter sp. faydin-H20]|uniref:lipid A deacylase LpxR family protein n=1 Tax=Helicobacter anatolicus TaxID=2905874 RepID=UPI001E5EE00E|nr:lipid A deacylase LpxR family protein [Helicobacter anatolicus]MCE3037017.1 lipid A deacylase LpxR family protein [Helicobacter anatolicus]